MLSLHCAELPDLPDQDEPAAAEHKGGAAQDRRRVRPTDLSSGEEKGSIALYPLYVIPLMVLDPIIICFEGRN